MASQTKLLPIIETRLLDRYYGRSMVDASAFGKSEMLSIEFDVSCGLDNLFIESATWHDTKTNWSPSSDPFESRDSALQFATEHRDDILTAIRTDLRENFAVR